MTFQSILKNIAKHISLTKEETEYFTSLLQCKEVRKKDFLLKEGQLCKTINYVHSGALRAFFVDKDGKESTIMFAIEDWWVTDMYCFVTDQPAMQNIIAIKDSYVLKLKKK
jgi:CRP-like cAMP-binding protein